MKKIEILTRDGTRFILQSIYLNPQFVVSVREDELMTRDLRCEQMKRKFPAGLDQNHTLSEVVYSEANHVKRVIAIGSPESIQSKLFDNRTLLKG